MEEPLHEIEKFFKCPYCLARISMILDLSIEEFQTYIEDCEVCCQPIQISFQAVNGELQSFRRSTI